MAIDINIPSQVKTYANLAAFPATGSLKTIFIAEDTNKTYRWTGSAYVEVSGSDLSGYVPTTRTLTINGTTQDLSADRTFTVSTGITIGTTAIASGTVGRVLFDGTGNVVQESANLFWDNTNGRLGIGTSSPATSLNVSGSVTAVSTLARSVLIDSTLVASNTADNLVGLDLNNTFTNGIYTGIRQIALRVQTGGLLMGATANDSNFTAFPLQINLTNASSNIGTIVKNGSATGYTSHRIYNNQNSSVRSLEIGYSGSSYSGAVLGSGVTGESGYLATTGNYALNIGTNNTTRMVIFNDGNIGVNTATNAGFKLDVNGTARFSGTNYQVVLQTTSNGIIKAQGGYQNTDGSYTADGNLFLKAGIGGSGNLYITPNNGNTTAFGLFANGTGFNIGLGLSTVASASFQINSTTQGFLCPRMTTTQINAIASPANGLQVYNTTISHMCVYQAGAWAKLSHSPM